MHYVSARLHFTVTHSERSGEQELYLPLSQNAFLDYVYAILLEDIW